MVVVVGLRLFCPRDVPGGGWESEGTFGCRFGCIFSLLSFGLGGGGGNSGWAIVCGFVEKNEFEDEFAEAIILFLGYVP